MKKPKIFFKKIADVELVELDGMPNIHFDYDKAESLLSVAMHDLHIKLEDRIKQRLDSMGYTFRDKAELIDFSKSRLSLDVKPSGLNVMLLDDSTFVCAWRHVEHYYINSLNAHANLTIDFFIDPTQAI